jgi:hypothetical protein
MLLTHLISGIVLGAVAAFSALLAGGFLWEAVAAYTLVGNTGVLGSAWALWRGAD